MKTARNPKPKTPRSGRFSLPDLLTRTHLILGMIAFGEMPLRARKQLEDRYGISRQLFSSDIRRMIKAGWLIDDNPLMNKYKYYKVTESGRTVLAGWEKGEQRILYKIENARHVCIIKNPKFLHSFLKKPEYQFKGVSTLNNVITYYGKIRGWAVALYEGNDITMVVTSPPLYTKDMMTGHHRIVQNTLDFLNDLNRKWLFELTIPEPTTHRQYTISDRFAKEVLKKTGGSQLKIVTPQGLVSIDQSHGTEERIEFSTADKAQEYLEVPDQIKILKEKIIGIEKTQVDTISVITNLTDAVLKNTTSIEKVADLISGQVKSGQESGKTTQQSQLNKDSEKMFG